MKRRVLSYLLGSALAGSGLVAAVAVAPPAHASPTTYEFTGLGDGHSWTDQMNWSPQGIPHSLDSIVVGTQAHPVAHVDGVLTTSLAGITLGAGGSLEGQPLTAATVHWTGGTIFNEITAITLLQVDGPDTKLLQSKDTTDLHAGRLLIEDQALLNGGELRTIRGTIVNEGTMASVGPPGSSVVVNGNFGSSAKGTFVNKGTLTAIQDATLTLQNFELDNQKALGGGPPALSGGTVEISGSALRLRTGSAIDDHVVIDDGTVATADGNVSLHSGSTFTASGSSSTTLSGTPSFTGTGTFAWLAATVNGRVTLSSGVTMEVSGSGTHKLDAAAGSPFTVSPGAFVTQQSGLLSLGIHTTVDNQGQWRVRGDAGVAGLSCCVPGSTAVFDNRGTVEVKAGVTLTLGTPGIDYLQRPAGAIIPDGAAGGRVTMLGSASELRGGRVSGVELDLAGNSTVAVSGTVTIDTGAVIRQTDSSDLTGGGTFGGAGTYRWSDGTIAGRFVFGPSVHLAIDDPDAPGSTKALLPDATGGGRLEVRGDSTIATTLPVQVTSTSTKSSTIVNQGAMTWSKGTIDFTGVPGTFVNQGALKIAPGSEPPATVRLDGSLVNKGDKLELTRRGTLAITGKYTQRPGGTTRVVIAGRTADVRDRFAVGGALDLDGTLALVRKNAGAPTTGYPMIVGASRSGKFAQITGLSQFPAGYHVRYTSTAVRLAS